jgi:nicotinamide-nucleotide amidase
MPEPPMPSPIASAEILAVGAELLVGETRDTNSGDLARYLTELGVEVQRMSQLADDLAVVTASIAAAVGRADLVVTTGGLGPTPDDLTRESIAAALGEQPAVDPGLESWLRLLWAQRGLPFSEVNLKQAWLIPSAEALPNPHGTAPGWWVEHVGRVIIALPGPPRELRPMWRDQALPRLLARGLGVDRAAETLRLTGIGESMVVDLVGADLLASANPRMATYARPDCVDLRVSAVADGEHSAAELVGNAIADLSPRIDPYVFGHGQDDWGVALAPRLGGRRMATIEVGTGGYLGLLLGATSFLVHAEQDASTDRDAAALAADVRARSGAEVGLSAIGRESGDDMVVEIGLDIEGEASQVVRTVFRGGDTGRRRSANAAAAELWRRLGD